MRKLTKAVRRLYKGEKGFTLIELLVVIGILAVLAGVVTLGVTQFIGRGATQAWLTEKHNMQTAVAAYMADNQGITPADISTLTAGGYLLTTPRWAVWLWDATTGAITNGNVPPAP